MPFRQILCLVTIWWSVSASAATVAFLEMRREDGSLVQLEPGGRFYHVAIRAGGKWLHAHTHRGVDLIEDLTAYGDPVYFLENPSYPDPSPGQVKRWLGKRFDMFFRWNNPDATYCTRLIADLLGVPPRPMEFKSEVWKDFRSAPVGQPGLSPDELFEDLLNRGFTPARTCEELLI